MKSPFKKWTSPTKGSFTVQAQEPLSLPFCPPPAVTITAPEIIVNQSAPVTASVLNQTAAVTANPFPPKPKAIVRSVSKMTTTTSACKPVTTAFTTAP